MRSYHELDFEERLEIERRLDGGESQRAIARTLRRAPSTISREVRRLRAGTSYRAQPAQHRARRARRQARVPRKLEEPRLWAFVTQQLRAGWSPQQIAGFLHRTSLDARTDRVSHETIYVQPRGALRTELIAALRQGRSARKPRSRGTDRRGRIPDMQSIHVRPPEVADRLIPGHWEGDLLKGAGNRSAIGTLVERTSGFVVLAAMRSATAPDALDGFGTALETIPPALRKTLTYDQGKEMSAHAALTRRTGVAVYFADPHSPWQRGSNENTNGLLRQYLPKGTELSGYTQAALDAIALSLNTRPRQRHGFRTPLEVYTELLQQAEAAHSTIPHPPVAPGV